jgi:ubiquitin carboxyl-terminal hydrolase 8
MAPEDFYSTVCRVFPLMGEQRGAQQDAHEVLSFLLDALHEDLNRAREKPPYEERKDLEENELHRKGEERYAAEAWHDHLRRHRSVLVDLCQGQLRSQVRCCECGCASVTFDPFLFLSLPLPQAMKRGLKEPIEAAIRAFCKEEKLEGEDRWGCPRCERRVSALKRLSLWKLPLLLFVHLKRFGFEATSSWDSAPSAWKIEGEVTVPFSRLNLQPFVADTSPQRVPLQYDLFAAVDHVGQSPLVGHYTAACRRADGWWRFDDSRAEFLGGEGEATAHAKVLGEDNYLLLFQRRDAPPEPELVREQSHRNPENWPHVKGDGVEWSFLHGAESSQQL